MTDTKKAGFFSVGLVRGLVFMLAGYLVGLVFVTVIRLIMGLPAIIPWNPTGNQYFFTEPAWVMAAIFGVVGILARGGCALRLAQAGQR